MPCTCTIEEWDLEDTEFYHDATKTARKKYECCECGCIIDPGEKYVNSSGKSDGRFWRYRTCAPCHEIRQCYFCSWAFTQMYDSLQDNIDGLELSGLEMLSPEARRKFFEKIDA